MEYATLGRSGLILSRFCLGMMSFGTTRWQPWVADKALGLRLFRAAVERGINVFDTADFYSWGESETILGEAIAGMNRDDVVIATKVGMPMADGPNRRGLSRKHILSAIDATLRRLGTDHVDLYQIHKWDPGVPIEETLDAMNDVVRAGKARYLGVSNCSAWRLVKAQYLAHNSGKAGFASVQMQLNLAYREDQREILPYCAEDGLGVIVYSPLARGWLAGARATAALTERELHRTKTDAKAHKLYGSASDEAVLAAVGKVAAARGVSLSQVALAWLLGQQVVSSIIIGAMEERHLDEAIAALDLRLEDAEIAALEAAYTPQQVKDDAMDVALSRTRARPISEPARGNTNKTMPLGGET